MGKSLLQITKYIQHDCQDFMAADSAYNLDKNWPKRNGADYTALTNKVARRYDYV